MPNNKEKTVSLKAFKELEEQLCALKRENKDLKLRDAQYNDILHNMGEAVEREAPDYTVTYVNRAFCEFYGVTKQEALEVDSMAWVVPEDRQRIDKQMKSLTPENPDYRYTCRVRTKRGELFWIEILGHCFFDEDGNVLEYQDISRDITAYKSAAVQAERFRVQMEEKVRERTLELTNTNHKLSIVNSYLQYTLNNISEGVIVVAEDGEVMLLNYGSNTNWNTDEDQLCNFIKETVLHDQSSAIFQLIHNRENFNNMEITFPSPKGDIQYLVSGAHIRNDAGVSQGILVLKPLSEVKHLVNKFSSAQAKFHFEDIVWKSPVMEDVINFAKRVAAGGGNIVIEGESGTGKELFAQSIHNASPRKNGPFIAVNCGAIPRDLIASELFGYTDGSFTGAKKGGKPGKFEMAAGGTLFLDEIGDMPLEQQIALLRVIQERTVTRIGGAKVIPVDVRIICATNKDLLQEVERGNFRRDLYYRLNVINLHIPPLRERKEDISLLFGHFFRSLSKKSIKDEEIIHTSFLQVLNTYSWPGNVRELQNVTERAFFISPRLPLTRDDLPEYLLQSLLKEDKTALIEPPNSTKMNISEARKAEKLHYEREERQRILLLLQEYNNNASQVAKAMDISRTTLYRKFNKYQIEK